MENNRWGNKGFFLSSGLRGPFTAVRVRIHRAGTGGRSLPRNVHFHSPSSDTGNSNPGVGLSRQRCVLGAREELTKSRD